MPLERVFDVIVHPDLGQEPGVGPLVDGGRRLAGQPRVAPGREHGLEGTRCALVGDPAVLEAETATVREEDGEEPAQLGGAAMDACCAA